MFDLTYLETYKKAEELAREELKSIVQNKSFPLEERWALYKKYGDGLADTGGYIYHPRCFQKKFDDAIEDKFYGDGNINRNETVELERWVENLEERLHSKWSDEEDRTFKVRKNNPDFDYNNIRKDIPYEDQKYITRIETLTQEDIDAFKEEILDKFIWSFEFDW